MAGEKSSSTALTRGETAFFECNICFDLAQDPVITLCGHLHCWPCLYQWLKLHSQSHQCPVCKTLIQEEKLIPLYGRGKATSIHLRNAKIPHRPAGLRPDTARPPPPQGSPRIGGFIPADPMALSNFEAHVSFGGVLSPVFSVRFHEFCGAGASGYGGSFGVDRVVAQGINDKKMKIVVFIILLFVLFDFLSI